MVTTRITARCLQAFILCAAFLITTLAARAQSYSIDWYTIDGGGETSSGGNFSLTGTIGQPDASATLSDGNFAVTGGFWSIIALQTPGSPLLNIQRAGNAAILSWLDNSGSFRLQHSTNMNTTSDWFDVSSALATNAGVISSTQTFVATNRQYFRLISP